MGIAQYRPFILTTEDNIEKVGGMAVSASYFSTLGVDALIGRYFEEEDMQAESGNVSILSHKFWRERFGGNVGIIGSSVILDEVSHEVIGIMPREVDFFLRNTSIWTPFKYEPRDTLPDANATRIRLMSTPESGHDLRGSAASKRRAAPSFGETVLVVV